MHQILKEKANDNCRSFNNEILFRLAKTLYEECEELTTTQGENYENI
jgi:hypothetical protein